MHRHRFVSFLCATMTFVELSRLSGRRQNDFLRAKGRVWKGKHMVIRFLLSAPKHPNVDPAQLAIYTGTLASAKLDKSAVKRNRMRRRCREALRLAVKDRSISSPIQLILSPRSSSLSADFTQLQADITQFLSSLSL